MHLPVSSKISPGKALVRNHSGTSSVTACEGTNLRCDQPVLNTMKANIKLDLKNLTPMRLYALLVHVVAQLDGNANFPMPPYSVAELRSKAVMLSEAITEATHGSRQSKIVRDGIVEDVKDTLRPTADYVRMIARGNELILNSSGFELAKQPEAVGEVDKPSMQSARMAKISGGVKLRWSGVRGRRTYQVYMVVADPGLDEPQWTLIASTSKNTHTVEGLDPYTPYYFCVSAVGPKGESFKSNAVLGRAA